MAWQDVFIAFILNQFGVLYSSSIVLTMSKSVMFFLLSMVHLQNVMVERKNMTLFDMVRTMIEEYKTPDWFWTKAMNTACHAIN
jgi:hypothetical protein